MPPQSTGRLAACALVAAGLVLGAIAAPGRASAAPFAFRDDYTTLSAVDTAATTAAVLTAPPGVVALPYAPFEAAFDPSGTYVLVAGPGGVAAYVDDGAAVRPIPDWRLGGLDATGVAWIAGGLAFAVATPSSVTVYGLSAQAGTRIARAAASAAYSGGTMVAAGPRSLRSAVLLANAGGAVLWTATGPRLVAHSGGPQGLEGNLGVAATADGSVAATWGRQGVQLWAWDGSAYRPAPAWDPPAAVGPARGVAFFPQGGGYWLITPSGVVWAFAYGTAGLEPLPRWSFQAVASAVPPIALAAGWSAGALAVVYPGGWNYWGIAAEGGISADPARSLSGQSWAVYVLTATLQSRVLAAGHAVAMLRVEDADCSADEAVGRCQKQPLLPEGTSIAYAVSTDGCVTWTSAPLWTNVAVATGSAVCYEVTLSTTDPRFTPVLDVTDLYEIASESELARLPSLLCTGACR